MRRRPFGLAAQVKIALKVAPAFLDAIAPPTFRQEISEEDRLIAARTGAPRDSERDGYSRRWRGRSAAH
jgi:hypothetical protein